MLSLGQDIFSELFHGRFNLRCSLDICYQLHQQVTSDKFVGTEPFEFYPLLLDNV
jgi:hypothetical protein